MPDTQPHPILRHLERYFPGVGAQERNDRQLLERFAQHKDEGAFAVLVERHGPMVHGVCRRLLRRIEDAEDAFQATFLVLARKAASVAWHDSVGRWLYQVAYRLSAEARSRIARRDSRERQAEDRLELAEARPEGLRDVCAVLDEALYGLPARYQEPLLLCYLRGLTRDQAAAQLGWSLRTLERRLARGRERLRNILSHRGVTLSAAFLASALTGVTADATVPTRLVAATVRAALPFATAHAALSGGVSASAAALAESALHSTAAFPTRIIVLVTLLLGLTGGLGLFMAMQGTERPQATQADPPAVREAADPPPGNEPLPPRQDRLGDPLPAGAVARMGSSRLRHLTHTASLGAEVSPDGKTLVTTSEYGIRAWSLETGKLLFQIKEEYAFHSVFSPDGKWLAVPGKEAVFLRDPATGRKLRRIPAEGALPRKADVLAFSADGRQLAAGIGEGELLVFDTATGKQTARLDAHGAGKLRAFYFLVFSPDGRNLLCMGRDVDGRDAICHWSLATQTLRKRVVPDFRGFRATVALSRDGRLLAVPAGRRPVTIWDTETGEVRCALEGDRNWAAYGLAFSDDGKTLATISGEDNEREATASLWDTVTGKLRRRLQVPRAALISVQFSPDGRLLIIPGGCLVRLWDIATGQEVLKQDAHAYSVTSLAFTPDGQSLVSAGGETIRVWDARTGEQRQVMPGHRWYVNQVMVRPDGRAVVSCGADGTVRVHELATGKELRRCLLDPDPDTRKQMTHQILRLGLSPDGKTASTMCTAEGPTSLLHLWDLDSGQMVVRQPHYGEVFACAFAPGGRVLATTRSVQDAAGNRTAEMGGDPPAKAPGKMKAGAGPGDTAAYSPPKTVVFLQEVATGRELVILPQPDKFSGVLAFTPDGQSLVTSTFTPPPDARSDGQGKMLYGPGGPGAQGPSTLRLWDLVTGKQRLAIKSARGGHDHDFARLAVAPDGRTLVTVRSDHMIQLWDLATGKELLRRAGHDAMVDGLAFAPDGKRLATGHQDSTILIWDLAAAYERRPRPGRAETRELEAWWRDLAGDAAQAHRAIWSLADVPAQAVPFLRDRVHPAAALPADELRTLVQDLDSPRFPRREEASRRLAEFGEDAEPALRRALADKPSVEVRQRLERILARPRPIPAPDALRSLRALQVLEAIGDDPARRALRTLAEGAPDARLTREARAALERVTQR
jgi:RNA polymerase sigma factor (sigma-70 family)